MTGGSGAVEDLLRELAPQVLAALIRRHGAFDLCEDAVQEALIDAAASWPDRGVPASPRGWLLTVANRRLIDLARAEQSRRAREERFAFGSPPSELLGMPGEDAGAADDTMVLLLLCCHPALTPPSQIALTLRAVGGLTTAEIASAFFVPEATMAQRISRAKQRIREAGATFSMPPAAELEARLAAVMHVLYLIFNEGYTASSGASVVRAELTSEAIRLARQLRRLRPDDGEAAGLLALMLLTEARRPARVTSSGDLVDLDDQDRSLWNRELITEGVDLVTTALASGPPGAYQLQAAIAAVHDEATSAQGTDWPEILGLYQVLERVAPSPMAALSQAIAAAMVHGPQAGLTMLGALASDERIRGHHRLFAIRGRLLEMAGDQQAAADALRTATRLTTSTAEKRYLRSRIAALEHRP